MSSQSFSEFLAAIEIGDMAGAASILRQFKSLKPGQIEEICDLLDPSLSEAVAKSFPHKLVRVQRSLGRPAATPTDRQLESFEASTAVAREISKGSNLKTALHSYAVEQNISIGSAKKKYQTGKKIKRPFGLKK